MTGWLGFLSCALYAGVLGIVSFFAGRLLARCTFHPERFPWRAYAWEDGLWKRLRIRRWQARVPDMSRLFTKLMPAKRLTKRTAADLPRMIAETCVAELTHTVLSFLGLAMPFLWRGAGGWIAAAVYIVFGNLTFILVQRYNRPRLLRLYQRQRAAGSKEH